MLADILKLIVTTNLKSVTKYTSPNGCQHRLSTIAPVGKVLKDTQLKSAFVSKSDVTNKSATSKVIFFSNGSIPAHLNESVRGARFLLRVGKSAILRKMGIFLYFSSFPTHQHFLDQYQYLGNCPLTPPLTQHSP